MFSDSHHGFSFVLSSFSNISRLQSEDFVSYPLVAWSLEIFSSLAREEKISKDHATNGYETKSSD